LLSAVPLLFGDNARRGTLRWFRRSRAVDEGSGMDVLDSSTNLNHSTLDNGAAWAAGQLGNAVSFAGAGENISNIGDQDELENLTNGFTFLAWINVDAFTGAHDAQILDKARVRQRGQIFNFHKPTGEGRARKSICEKM
jgi:hypothetical protein